MTFLNAEHISVSKGGRRILSDVSFTAGAGEFVAVIGPNGAGKSTLLSALAGLIKPASGQISLDGKLFARISLGDLARRRAYLPQSPHVEWPISVERLVALGLTAHLPALGALPPALTDAVTRALEMFDLTAHRLQPATTLSGGELARAMLARATVAEPDILIVDEPVTGLDPRHAMESMRHLSAYAAAGRLVIASLHDLTLAARHATRIMALKQGTIAGEGPLNPALIRTIFDVESRVRGEAPFVTVDILSP